VHFQPKLTGQNKSFYITTYPRSTVGIFYLKQKKYS